MAFPNIDLSQTNLDNIFGCIDENGDQKIEKDEMESFLRKLTDNNKGTTFLKDNTDKDFSQLNLVK